MNPMPDFPQWEYYFPPPAGACSAEAAAPQELNGSTGRRPRLTPRGLERTGEGAPALRNNGPGKSHILTENVSFRVAPPGGKGAEMRSAAGVNTSFCPFLGASRATLEKPHAGTFLFWGCFSENRTKTGIEVGTALPATSRPLKLSYLWLALRFEIKTTP